MLSPPVLSMFDPVVESEGSVDPLSLQPIYDRLADRMLPAMTVRMRRLRFVTAICAGARVCEGQFAADEVAADEVTPPWLVFEWFVVEALVRERVDDGPLGIPGGNKVATAIRDKRALGERTYLKTASVFGFSGIFRRLVTRLRVLTEDLHLDDGGYRILSAWERDQRVDGFVSGTSETTGGALRERLLRAVREGMRAGSTTKRSKDFWETVAAAFTPDSIGKHERSAIFDVLANSSVGEPGHAQELIRAVAKRGSVIERADEARFLRSMASNATRELAAVMRAIDAYEAVCRPLTDAFSLLRFLSTRAGGPIRKDEFAADSRAVKIAKALRTGAHRVLEDPNLGEWEKEAAKWAVELQQVDSAARLYTATLDHHTNAQKSKPPDGKRDWFEKTRHGVIVRHAYALKELPDEPPYVHQYRIPTLSRFLDELGRLS